MALKYPLANGVWSNAANWNDGTLPIAGDDVRANGKTVTIDQDINVLQISTAGLAPALTGGSWLVNTNRNITADCVAGSTNCLSSSTAVTVNIIGNIFGGGQFSQMTVLFTSAASVLNITGNSFAPTGGGGGPTSVNSIGTVIFVGNAIAGSGNPSGGSAIFVQTGGNLTFTGIASGGGVGTSVAAIAILCAGNSTINGTINAGSNPNSFGLRLTGGNHIINADCFAGSVANANACTITNSTATFNGNIFGSSTIATSVGLFVADAVSNVVVSQITFGSLGTVPVSGFVKFKNTAPTITITKANNTTQQLVDPSTTDIPVIGNVRDGVTYASGALTGTLKVPPPTAVSVGVPTDNVVGTAVITITDMGALLASFQV